MESLPYWFRGQNPIRGEGEIPAAADLVIIGAGITGASVAWWASRARLGSVWILEERPAPATGASGRNAGFNLAGTVTPYPELIRRFGREAARAIWAYTIENNRAVRATLEELGYDVELVRSGSLLLAASEAERADQLLAAALLREDGFPVESLEHDDVARLWGFPVPDRFWGALFNPEDARWNPAKASQGLLRSAQLEGARLALESPVWHLEEGSGSVRLYTPKGRIEAGAVVLATNAWVGRLIRELVGRVVPVRAQVLATAPIPRLFPHATSTNYGYEYWQQDQEGRLILGGYRWSVPDREIGCAVEGLRPEVQAGLERFLRQTFPQLADVPIEYRWSGIMGFSYDELPLLGPVPGWSRLWMAGGYTGHGTAFAFWFGRDLVRALQEGWYPEGALRYFDTARLERLASV
ncbi:MAG: FAD-binding oxidoreductase [Bacteroidetes bacterium]|nr:FAD-binding oxidoreductase [Rhodothermia bacterium]MCX7906732.1 FAD-binding oxidoreductase [Bacteroidota bacterium]MDW8285141.1 FAD-dependent oxidoreductase [Bacteroidota bacterium]